MVDNIKKYVSLLMYIFRVRYHFSHFRLERKNEHIHLIFCQCGAHPLLFDPGDGPAPIILGIVMIGPGHSNQTRL